MYQEQLQNARDYFENVTAPAYRQFMQAEVTMAAVYGMAASLFHLAEWVYVHDRSKIGAKYGTEIRYGGELWDRVVMRKVAGADLLRDIANTGKTIKLSFRDKPKAGDRFVASHLAAHTFVSVSPVEGQGGPKPIGLSKEAALEPIATAVFEFWKALIDEFYPMAVVKGTPSTPRGRPIETAETASSPKMRY